MEVLIPVVILLSLLMVSLIRFDGVPRISFDCFRQYPIALSAYYHFCTADWISSIYGTAVGSSGLCSGGAYTSIHAVYLSAYGIAKVNCCGGD